MQTIYQTQINQIGSSVLDFLGDNMVILFGDNAPDELRDYCLLIDINNIEGEIEKGNILALGNKEYKITAVGDAVNRNLSSLGHITLKFDGSETPELPGTLYLETADLQEPQVGLLIQILKK